MVHWVKLHISAGSFDIEVYQKSLAHEFEHEIHEDIAKDCYAIWRWLFRVTECIHERTDFVCERW